MCFSRRESLRTTCSAALITPHNAAVAIYRGCAECATTGRPMGRLMSVSGLPPRDLRFVNAAAVLVLHAIARWFTSGETLRARQGLLGMLRSLAEYPRTPCTRTSNAIKDGRFLVVEFQ